MIRENWTEIIRACLWAGPFFIGLQSAGSVAEKRTKRTTISEWVDNQITFVIRFFRQVRTATCCAGSDMTRNRPSEPQKVPPGER